MRSPLSKMMLCIRAENRLSSAGDSLSLAIFASALVTIVMTANLPAQVMFNGQASSALIKSDDQQSQYSYNHGKTTFNWRLDLFGNILIDENITFRSSLRLYQDQSMRVDLFDLSISHISSLDFTLDMGEIELPLGNLGERRFPMKNPFYNLPLINEHYTSLRSSDYAPWPYGNQYAASGNGVRLLDRGLYDLGMKLSGSFGISDVSLAIINGSPSTTSVYTSGGLNSGDQFGFIGRVAVTPSTGLTMGLSFGTGRLNAAPSVRLTANGYNNATLRQYLLAADIDYSIGHLVLDGMLIDNVWRYDNTALDDLKAIGYSFEATYTFAPRFSASARVGGIAFSTIHEILPVTDDSLALYDGQWDHTVMRFEGALGYRLSREALMKLIYHLDDTYGLQPEPLEHIVILQLVVSFR